MGTLKYKGYIGSVEYSEEDDCLFGKVQGMNKDCITYEGQTLTDLKQDFEESVDMYLDSCRQRGIEPRKAYNGVLNIRIAPDVHSRIALFAKQTGTTINAFVNQALETHLQTQHIY
jgi:predicted HicB family RNase H-like nuclease